MFDTLSDRLGAIFEGLRGKGAPKSEGGRGDQIIRLVIDVPLNDPDLEAFIEDWTPPTGYDPRKRFMS